MLTKEEIRKIARRFSEETSNGDALDPHIDFAAQYAEEVIGWLAEHYCLVEKSEVTDWVNALEFAIPDIRSAMMMKIGAKRLFGKEMFEE